MLQLLCVVLIICYFHPTHDAGVSEHRICLVMQPIWQGLLHCEHVPPQKVSAFWGCLLCHLPEILVWHASIKPTLPSGHTFTACPNLLRLSISAAVNCCFAICHTLLGDFRWESSSRKDLFIVNAVHITLVSRNQQGLGKFRKAGTSGRVWWALKVQGKGYRGLWGPLGQD